MISVPERAGDELEVLRKMLDGFEKGFRVASVGIINSFDAATQSAKVQIAVRERVFNITTRLFDNIEIPLLLDVPVQFPSAGGFSLAFPVAPGDECLVIFSDSCIDAWWQNGGIQNQIDVRRHDLSDGIAILGIKSKPNAVTASNNSVQLRNAAGDVMVEVKNDVVNIGGGTFRKIIDERVKTFFDAHVHTSASPGNPTSAPTIPLDLTACATTKSKVG